jgi:hypothetical protein
MSERDKIFWALILMWVALMGIWFTITHDPFPKVNDYWFTDLNGNKHTFNNNNTGTGL